MGSSRLRKFVKIWKTRQWLISGISVAREKT
jgi:hypothetical protein